MNLKINTVQLQNLVSKAVRGVGNNKLLPITSLMCIKTESGRVHIVTNDGTNYLYVSEPIDTADDFYAVVDADRFSKLISKLTCQTVALSVTDGVMEIVGNGRYKIELPLDENGEPVVYPNVLSDRLTTPPVETISMSSSTINTILTSVKPALAVTAENPQYMSYYVGDKVVATDVYVISSLSEKLLSEPKLISAEMMNLLSVVTSDTVELRVYENNSICFVSDDVIICGVSPLGIEDYSIVQISKLVDSEFPYNVVLSKDEVLSALDRVALFVGEYDNNIVTFDFQEDGVHVSSKNSNSEEILQYVSSKFEPYTVLLDIRTMQTQVKSIIGDTVELWFGVPNSVKIVTGELTTIIAVSEE